MAKETIGVIWSKINDCTRRILQQSYFVRSSGQIATWLYMKYVRWLGTRSLPDTRKSNGYQYWNSSRNVLQSRSTRETSKSFHTDVNAAGLCQSINSFFSAPFVPSLVTLSTRFPSSLVYLSLISFSHFLSSLSLYLSPRVSLYLSICLKIGLGRETFSCNHKSVRLILSLYKLQYLPYTSTQKNRYQPYTSKKEDLWDIFHQISCLII